MCIAACWHGWLWQAAKVALERARLVNVQVEAIRFLVQAGCSASVQDSVASTPLHIAAGEGHIEAIRVLKRPGERSEQSGCSSSARHTLAQIDVVLA